MIDLGANPLTINKFGQTMLHVLHVNDPLDLTRVFSLLRKLTYRGFPFAHRDYYGRTVLHALLADLPTGFLPESSVWVIKELLKILKLDLYCYDVFGQTIFRLLVKSGPQNYSYSAEIGSGVGYPATITHSAILTTSDLSRAWHWQERITQAGLVNWIDINGNAPLVAILKYWPPEQNELELNGIVKELILQGAQIHMRDRNGDTALTIGSVRGYRPATKTLLAAGANIHSRDFTGTGILVQTRRALRQAKMEGNSGLYARILTCLVLLADAGAKDHPTEFDEWRS
jgi:hypothetical protein